MELAQAYAQTLAGALGDKAKVYRYADSLTTLWANELPADDPTVIVWDRKPLGDSPDDHLLEKHLTPLDWALAWSLKHVRGGQSVPAIVIIDATAGDWKDTWAWSVRHQLLGDMPWVTLSAPLMSERGTPLYRWTISKMAMDNAGIAEDGVIRKANDAWSLFPNPSKEIPNRTTLEGLNKLWSASLRLSDEHHDINNIVTPLLLLEYPEELDSRTAEAMLLRLQWTGMRQPPTQTAPGEKPREEAQQKKDTTRLVVVDDRVSRWAPVLANILDIQYRGRPLRAPGLEDHNAFDRVTPEDELFEIWVAAKLDVLQGTSKPPLTNNGLNTRLFFTPGAEAEKVKEILCLDLDLGPSSETYYTQFIEAAGELDNCGRSNHLWGMPLISEDRPSAVLLGAKRGTAEWRELLTLPARVLATIDPALPIILFASTTKRDVIEKLKPFYNIVTGFEKPQMFAGAHRDTLESARSRFHECIDRAKEILQVRQTLRAIGKRAALPSFLTCEMKQILKNLDQAIPVIIDIFVDETGSQHTSHDDLTVGALVMLTQLSQKQCDEWEYPYATPVSELVKQVRNSWANGEYYGSRLDNCPGCSGNGKHNQKGSHLKYMFRSSVNADVLNGLKELFSYNVLSAKNSTFDANLDFFLLGKGLPKSDFLYRITLSALLEYIIIHQIRTTVDHNDIRIRLHLANLSLPISGVDNPANEYIAWGTSLEDYYIRYLGDDAARPMLADVLRKQEFKPVRMQRARSFKLDIADTSIVATHHLIDALLSKDFGLSPTAEGEISKKLIRELQAAEAGVNNQIGECLAKYHDVKKSNFPAKMSNIRSRLRDCIAGYVAQATGADLAEAARLIAASAK